MSNWADAGALSKALPPYLSESRKGAFAEALKDFPRAKPLYKANSDPDPLQGDVWTGVLFLDFPYGVGRRAVGLLITNSCDADSSNKRLYPQSLSFALAISADKYKAALLAAHDAAKVASHLEDVRSQRVTSMVYLPADGVLDEDRIAMLDQIQSVPISFIKEAELKRASSLSDIGFYLLAFKLSIHFCRLLEGVDRTPD